MTGGAKSLDKIVGMTQDGWEHTRLGEYRVFTKAFPQIKDIPSIGGYHDNILNSERILALKPDVLLINRSQYADNSQRVEVFERAGIRVVVLDYHSMKPENHAKSTEIVGRLLGREDVAAAQAMRYKEVLAEIDRRISALPGEKKHRRVYVECGTDGVGKYGNSYNGEILWGRHSEESWCGEHCRGHEGALRRSRPRIRGGVEPADRGDCRQHLAERG